MKKININYITPIFFTTYSISFADSLNLSGEGAILIDSDTGQVLYEKKSSYRNYIQLVLLKL